VATISAEGRRQRIAWAYWAELGRATGRLGPVSVGMKEIKAGHKKGIGPK
jgi:hypothetical protein